MIIEALDAANGDAAILRHAGSNGQDVVGLIDGGPSSVFANAIEPALAAHGISAGQRGLDWLAVSHVDSDHIGGVLNLVGANFGVGEFYFNTPSPFPNTGVVPAAIGGASPAQVLEDELADLLNRAPLGDFAQVASIGQGQTLLNEIVQRGIHLLNPPKNQRLLVGDTCVIDGLTLHVVAPSQARIDALLIEWAAAVDGAEPASAEKMDDSVTNLSSLAFLAEAGDRTALFTGDALEDDVMAGLKSLGHALPMHVNVLKVPHHGSNSAANPDSLETGDGLIENVTADNYIVSANGASTNPSPATLQRIVAAAPAGSTIWLPSPPSTAATTRAQYYVEQLAELAAMVAGTGITVEVGDGTPQVIDLT
jgi:hypothetical protein